MKVHYKKALAASIGILGIIILLLNTILAVLGTVKIAQFCLGGFISVMSFLYFTKPIFELKENELVLYNLLGMPLKRYQFEKLSDLRAEGHKITLLQNGKFVPIQIKKTLACTKEWNNFLEKISPSQASN